MEWYEYFRGNDEEEYRYQIFKERFEAEQEGKTLNEELEKADIRLENEAREKAEVAEYYRNKRRTK